MVHMISTQNKKIYLKIYFDLNSEFSSENYVSIGPHRAVLTEISKLKLSTLTDDK